MSSQMPQVATETSSSPVYRVDRFVVPAAARQRFLATLVATRDFLAGLEGCHQSLVLEEELEAGRLRMLTIVEWRDEEAFAAAKLAAAERYRSSNFNPSELIAELGVEPEFSSYRQAA